ncbi:MAG TPA: hypothetical protein VF037_04280 [Gemmatimonadales bacterium]
MPRRFRAARYVGVLALAHASACSEPVGPKPPVQHVIAESGGGQAGQVLDTLREHLVVRVVDDRGEPVAGAPVSWTSPDVTVQIVAVDRRSDAGGRARAIAILGYLPGDQRIAATVEGFDEQAEFAVSARSRPGIRAVRLMKSSSTDHMCAIDPDGRAWCWGEGRLGQLGDGTAVTRDEPRQVLSDQRFLSLAGYWSTTCGITADRSLWCWGQNQAGTHGGLFGNGDLAPSLVPVRAGGGRAFTAFDIDYPAACGVDTAGDAWCWGRLIGDAPVAESPSPVQVGIGMKWRDISLSGGDRVCAVSVEYAVYCWAEGSFGAAAAGIEGDYRTPQRIPGIPPLSSISVSWYNQCGLATAGAVAVCWGYGLNGVVQASAMPPAYPRPGGGGVSAISVRANTGMARGTDGRLWIWGEPPQCCDGWISTAPVELDVPGPWTDFTPSGRGAWGILAADSTVYSWIGFGIGVPARLLPRPLPPP